jgi:hypothetical protein
LLICIMTMTKTKTKTMTKNKIQNRSLRDHLDLFLNGIFNFGTLCHGRIEMFAKGSENCRSEPWLTPVGSGVGGLIQHTQHFSAFLSMYILPASLSLIIEF